MKKIIIILIALLSVFYGCTEYLTLPPLDELIREEYWKTEIDVENVVAQAYAKTAYILDDIYKWSELRGGLLSPSAKFVNAKTSEFYNFNVNTYNELTKWGDFYHIINLANTIIEYAPLAKDNDQTFTELAFNGYIAEAYYLRSLCYFFLVKSFKEVPLVLKSYDKDDQDFDMEKTSEQEIINHLIADLTGIVGKAFKANYYNPGDRRQKGRVNEDAINALLAEIYLWNNDYQNCIATCNKISDLSYPLEDGENYMYIFAGNGNSLESIFELQFDYNAYDTRNYYEKEGDNRKTLYALTSNRAQGDRESVVSDFLKGLYSLNDLRQTSPTGDVTYHSTLLSIWKYEGNSPFDPNNKDRFPDRAYNQSDANWIFHRYPDIILMKAEAYAELDDFANSLTQLNIVRKRAGIGSLSITDKKSLLVEILNERAREFVGEGKRWFDLVRVCRRDLDNRLSIISEAVISNVDAASRSAVVTRIKDTNSWFLPIYHEELIVNKKLIQNPFYR